MTLDDIIIGLNNRIKELERRDRTAKRTGKIKEVDAEKGLARVELLAEGFGGKPFLSPWVPWAEQAAGTGKTHFPPSVGQQVEITSETGDLTDGVIQQSIPSDQNPRPSTSGSEFVLIDNGGVRIAVEGGNLKITAANFRVEAPGTDIFSDTVQINGGALKHNDHEIGSTHKHIGVTPGGGLTGEPE